ncbi:hypothetical protein N7475_007411 [Penicillium sp. IBT 31633x]|nr:hypothetical protein N7475_007411 [Penicillium sp. IBT 31633x]
MAAPTNETPSSALGKREDVITCGLECLKDSVQCQKVANKDDGKLLQCVKWAVACNTECACLDQVENHGGDIRRIHPRNEIVVAEDHETDG